MSFFWVIFVSILNIIAQNGSFLPARITRFPDGHYMYHQFNIKQVHVLPTQCVYVFCVDLKTNSDYFTVQHRLIGFYN